MEINKKALRSIVFLIFGCIFFYWLLHETERLTSALKLAGNILSPFLIGAALAFILNVPMRGIERWLFGIKKDGLRRACAIVVTLIFVAFAIGIVLLLIVPQLENTVKSLIPALVTFFNRTKDSIFQILSENPEVLEWLESNTEFSKINWSNLIQQALGIVGNSVAVIMNSVLSAIGSLSSGVFNAIISLVFALYCLSGKETLASHARRLLYSIFSEHVSDEIVRIMRLTNRTFSNFISGQCVEALILGCMFAVTMPIFGFPYMPLVSVIIAVTALIPIVGAFVGCALGAFFILVVNPIQAVWFVVLFLVLQQIEGNVIYPRVVGTSIGLPGIWVLLAASVGGDLFGVGGMLVMIPLASVAYALLREFTQNRLDAKGIPPDKLTAQPMEASARRGFPLVSLVKRKKRVTVKKDSGQDE